MTEHTTKTGRKLTDADIDALAEEVETADYPVEELKARRRAGNPSSLRITRSRRSTAIYAQPRP